MKDARKRNNARDTVRRGERRMMEQRGCRRAADAPSAVNGRPQAESIERSAWSSGGNAHGDWRERREKRQEKARVAKPIVPKRRLDPPGATGCDGEKANHGCGRAYRGEIYGGPGRSTWILVQSQTSGPKRPSCASPARMWPGCRSRASWAPVR